MNAMPVNSLKLQVPGRRAAGVTLLEILVVVVVLAVLAAVVVASFSDATDTTKATVLSQSTANMQRQIQLYALQNGSFPASHNDFQASWFANGLPTNPFFPSSPQSYETVNGPADQVHPSNISSGAAFWYNATNGVFRARVTGQGADAQQLYNTANGI